MRSLLLLPPAILSVLTAADAGPTAIRKLAPDSSLKLFPEHLAFAPLPAAFNPPTLPSLDSDNDTVPRLYMRAFSPHFESDSETMLRRAAEVLSILERRASCPRGMTSCADVGSPNKCCQEGTYCTDVKDSDVGHVACCPRGQECGGEVGDCPSEAVSCPSSLGGGCCIEGYVCQGVGCVRPGETTTRETSTRQSTTTETEERTSTSVEEPSTTEAPSTTEEPSTTEAETTSEEPTTRETETGESTITSAPESSSTQEGCPTGFYGCLATHGGGCCRTDRNCETFDCPAPTSTTLGSGDPTVVVPENEVPDTTETCAGGWFLCGEEGGPTAGCCPDGYSCGSVSCFTEESSATQRVQKEFPDEDGVARVVAGWTVGLVSGVVGMMLMI